LTGDTINEGERSSENGAQAFEVAAGAFELYEIADDFFHAGGFEYGIYGRF